MTDDHDLDRYATINGNRRLFIRLVVAVVVEKKRKIGFHVP